MSPYLPKAVIATEDRRFYSHFGIDPIGLAARRRRQSARRPYRPGRQHDHPAARQEPVPDAGAQPRPENPAKRCWRCGSSTASPRTRSSKSISTASISAPAPMASMPRRTAISANRRAKLEPVRKRRHRRPVKGADPVQPGARPRRGGASAPRKCSTTWSRPGFITAAQARPPHSAGPRARGPTAGRGRAISPIGSPTRSRDFAGTANRDLTVAHDARPADAGAAEAAIARRLARYGAKDGGQPGRAGGDGAGRRGARDGRRPRLRRRASSTARPRRSVSPARRSSRSSISPGSRRGCARSDRLVDAPIRIGNWQPHNYRRTATRAR